MIAGFTSKQTCQLLVLKEKISRSISLTNHTKNSNGQSFLRNSQGIPHQFSEIVTRSFAVSRSWPTHLDRSLQPGARLSLEIRPSHRSCDSGAFAKQWGGGGGLQTHANQKLYMHIAWPCVHLLYYIMLVCATRTNSIQHAKTLVRIWHIAAVFSIHRKYGHSVILPNLGCGEWSMPLPPPPHQAKRVQSESVRNAHKVETRQHETR